jgi:hypothetical protein
MKIYGVVTMDIVDSRRISNRNVFQEKLYKYINIVNEKYKSILPVPINFTVGDEWQLFTDSPGECYNIIHDFQQLLWLEEVSFYAGIGIGRLSTNIYNNTGMMDGRCFLLAREAIDIAKIKNKQKNRQIHSKDNNIFFKSDLSLADALLFSSNLFSNDQHDVLMDEIALSSNNDFPYNTLNLDKLINVLIENTEILKNKMTYKQKETYINYLNYKSYRKMIKESSIYQTESTSSISQKLNTANYFTLQNNHVVIKSLINHAYNLLDKLNSNLLD